MSKAQEDKLSFLSPKDGAKQNLSRELIHSWNQLVLRARFSNTPVGFSADAEKQQAVFVWNRQREEYRQRHEYALLASPLPDCDFFAGRQAELSAIEKFFLAGDGRTKLVLHGMGGMGKTTLARQAVERLRGRYEKILWLSYRGDLLRTICDDGQLQIKNLAWRDAHCKSQQAYFKEKWQILCDLLRRERVLLVLDDMNGTKERKLSLLRALPCDVLVTSRIFRPTWQVSQLALEPLQSESDWQAFYAGYSAEAVSPSRTKQLEAYRNTVQGNTLLMRLAVCHAALHPVIENGMGPYFLRTNALNATDIQTLRYLSLLRQTAWKRSVFCLPPG